MADKRKLKKPTVPPTAPAVHRGAEHRIRPPMLEEPHPDRNKISNRGRKAMNGLTILEFAQKRIAEIHGEEYWHPAVFLLMSSADKDLTFDQRSAAAKAVMPYIMPQLKSVEIKGDPDKPVEVRVRDLRERVFSRLGLDQTVIDVAAIAAEDDE